MDFDFVARVISFAVYTNHEVEESKLEEAFYQIRRIKINKAGGHEEIIKKVLINLEKYKDDFRLFLKHRREVVSCLNKEQDLSLFEIINKIYSANGRITLVEQNILNLNKLKGI